MDDFKEMGMGGFHVHCRVGLDTEYLGEEFMADVKAVEEKAKKEGLLTYLYDEDRWPSGAAGGIVTKNPEYRIHFLVLSPREYKEPPQLSFNSSGKAVRSNMRTPIGMYRIHLDENGYMKAYEKVTEEEIREGDNIWTAHIEISGDSPWYNNQAYVDTLSKGAMDEFIRVTHEKYYRELGEDFGKAIPSIFTDEPQATHKEMLIDPFSRMQVILPFAADFEETFQAEYGFSLVDRLPELLWEKGPEEISRARYCYHAHVVDRFSRAFGDNIGTWCREHGIQLTGHMMAEWMLQCQTMAIGDVMRPLKEFGIPGIDMLCDRREFATAKQCVSVARQGGKEGAMCEVYGVTGWTYDFRNHKLGGDWQAALGINLRVHHLTWASMEGEGKRDYPASIGYQSPWYREYPAIENHFARVNTAMVRGKARVRVGVIHPIESYWLAWGNKEQTAIKRMAMEENFESLIQWLLFGLIDFDFISEALLNEYPEGNYENGFPVGAMSYDVVLVPGMETIRSSTLSRLKKFKEKGGKIYFLGSEPKYIDAEPAEEVRSFSAGCEKLPYNRAVILQELESYRDVDVDSFPVNGVDPTRMTYRENGNRANNLFYQLREDNGCRWLFLAHVNKPRNEMITYDEKLIARIRGRWQPTLYDTMTGEIQPLKAEYRNGFTRIILLGSAQSSFLIRLESSEKDSWEGYSFPMPYDGVKAYLEQPEKTELDEDNVVLLDAAAYSFDGDAEQPKEELLRIDNKFREKLGYPLRMEALAQPWTEKPAKPEHELMLRFTVDSDIERDHVDLAMERPEEAKIQWNGKAVPSVVSGWYTDRDIRRVSLGKLEKGCNELILRIPFGRKTNVEWCYLLGSFGAEVTGKNIRITEPAGQIVYGDITRQGLPFYGGNVIYKNRIRTEAGELHIEVPHYKGALVSVYLDGKDCGRIFLAPYRLNLGKVEAGEHELTLRLYGNRENTFGAIHHADETEPWYGPNLWRTAGNLWAYEYQLTRTGILTTPMYWTE